MTLGLALMNCEFAVLLSDGRLTYSGRLVDDKSNKVGVLRCADGIFAYSFTGIATAGSFRTSHWLLALLGECAPPDYSVSGIVQRLVEKASHDFAHNPDLARLSVLDRRLEIMFAGYLYSDEPPRAVHFVISNMAGASDGGECQFRYSCCFESRPSTDVPSMVAVIGQEQSMAKRDIEVLSHMLRERRPAEALVGKAVEVMHSAADRADDLVGKQLSSVTIRRDTGEIEAAYHSHKVARQIYLPDIITVTGEADTRMRDITVWVPDQGPGSALEVPKVGRNRPCPCGSGRKYKHCHGRRNA